MEYQIWRNLIQMMSFRNDLIDTIKPFFEQLNNSNKNEKYSINEEKHIPFLKSLSKFQIELLHKYEIIDEAKYTILVFKKEIPSKNISNIVSESLNYIEEIVRGIIEADNLEGLQRIIRENDINTINFVIKSFNEVKIMKIPILIYCIIHKSIKCFKFLLINGVDDPKKTMQEENHDNKNWQNEDHYKWDCIAIAIYFGEREIMKILEEEGIKKGNNPGHIEAAILSYRNSIAKEIINQMKEK